MWRSLCELFKRKLCEVIARLYLQRLKMSQVAEVAGVNVQKGIVGDISARVNSNIAKLSQSHKQ